MKGGDMSERDEQLGAVLFDDYAERALLGTVIAAPDAAREVFLSVAPDDWYRPRHAELAAVVSRMLRNGQGVDAVAVLGQVTAQGLAGSWDAPGVFELIQLASVAHVAVEHAKRVRALSGRRKLVFGCRRAIQRLESPAYSDEDGDVHATAVELRQFCDDAETASSDRSQPVPTGMDAFLAEPDTHDWLVPGLLERMDRTIITGGEGGGKSVLCSQFAACLAGGLHPFSGQVLGRGDQNVRVLVLDCENSPAQSRRRYRRVVQRVNLKRDMDGLNPLRWDEWLSIDMRPAGVDLLSARDVSWVEHAISACAPDLVVIGPLYKLHHRNPSDEEAAREVSWVLDGLRERHGIALLTEAHAGKGKDESTGDRIMSPIGSSMWLRWPEFGFGLLPKRDGERDKSGRAKEVDVVSWRGAREERAWPSELSWGHTLPWVAGPDYEAESSSTL
ncbi:DnaB-like dsDNA helicase [Gordonia phage Goib]|uniref:DnaB-like dsDNA helicase n=2 Tax=Vendettavirus vendetta TaxID=2049886 RepID=A0A160DD13_9CAUD|nr:DnaB-like dsDNA helicase [Gordonia phage Vendetta]YP_009275407.1 DnaB-like dsDNA helicase [Gordonia phage Splinter]ANA85600.1 DnaB-like dsDNA helicase [Gordonia phage Vendetta]ANA85679.1 DnaB-like dsDNA helicase [Gordonia phage Splinter]WNO25796.1 DnaB-like dsDNA helicase [Gordonia phage Goib]